MTIYGFTNTEKQAKTLVEALRNDLGVTAVFREAITSYREIEGIKCQVPSDRESAESVHCVVEGDDNFNSHVSDQIPFVRGYCKGFMQAWSKFEDVATKSGEDRRRICPTSIRER